MESHADNDFLEAQQATFLNDLRDKAKRMKDAGASSITGGTPEERPLAQWEQFGVTVRQLPDDEQGILRISVGGGETPVPVNYCVFRGDRKACADLLRKALAALTMPIK